MQEFEEDCEVSELLPPEALLDSNNPANDNYLREIAMLKRLIVSESKKLKPKHVEMVKKHHLNKTNVLIAEELGVAAGTVGKALKQKPALKLLALLRHLALMMDGPREGQRRNFLWRIAMRNELEDPRTAIAAVAEINKMTHQDKQLELGSAGLGGNVVQVVINNEQFPRGILDQ